MEWARETAGEQIKINERDKTECGWWRRGKGGRILQKLRCRHNLKHLVSMYCLLFFFTLRIRPPLFARKIDSLHYIVESG